MGKVLREAHGVTPEVGFSPLGSTRMLPRCGAGSMVLPEICSFVSPSVSAGKAAPDARHGPGSSSADGMWQRFRLYFQFSDQVLLNC